MGLILPAGYGGESATVQKITVLHETALNRDVCFLQ